MSKVRAWRVIPRQRWEPISGMAWGVISSEYSPERKIETHPYKF